MTLFDRLVAVIAVCSIFVTSLTLPTSLFDTTLSLASKNSADTTPPTDCTVEENASYDNYGITVPVAYSVAQCDQAHDAIAEVTADFNDEWVCQPYGDWTIMIFSAEKGAAKQVDDAMSTVVTSFTFQCANSQAARSMLIKKEGPIFPGTQSCTADAHGAFNTYHIHIGEPFDWQRCAQFQHNHLDIKGLSVREFNCYQSPFSQTNVKFLATAYKADRINSAAHDTWPEVNEFNCPNY